MNYNKNDTMRKANNNKKENIVKSELPKSFKCPYCFNKIMANGVAFRSRTIYTKQDISEFSEQEAENKKIYLEATDELYEGFWKLYPGSKPQNTKENPTYEKHPVLSPFDERYITDTKLKDGMKLIFNTDADGFTNEAIDTEGVSTKIRICPHCHNKLPFEFGKYPIKYISVVGITSSGKTVFLSQLLSNIDDYLDTVGMTIAGLTQEVDDFVRKYRIRRGEKLPAGNATNVLTRPLPINVKINKTGQKATLVFYDIAGENCVNPEQMEKYGQFIRNADGIIMVVDPKQFPDLLFLNDEEEMEDAYHPNRVAKAMYESFGSSEFLGGECNTPLAATISKSDLLRNCQHIAAGENSNIFRTIEYENYNGFGLAYEDWRSITSEVEMLLKKSKRGRLLVNTLEQYFPNSSYFAVSALNNKPTVLEEGKVKRYQMDVLPKPVRIEEPLYWILQRLGIVTEVHKKSGSNHIDNSKSDGNGKKEIGGLLKGLFH